MILSTRKASARKLLRDLVEQQWLSHGPECAIDGLRLTRSLEPSGTIRALYQTSCCMVLQGAKVSAIGDTVFHYGQDECLFASVNVPVNSRIVEATADRPYLALSLSIDPTVISELLVAQPEMAYRGPKQAALVTARMPDDLYDPVIRLLHLLDQPHNREVLEPLVRREKTRS
ncbi:AraC family transcriptional regulator [Marinobacter sp.]|uniref:AraC family transcriptional regulator n=1 Tax=Marinobacter sp. TaxID=50741 RepID=UPI003A905B91